MDEMELAAIERDIGRPLPSAYRAFLRDAERGVLRRLVGLDFAPARLAANREYADYLLRISRADYRLTPDDVVFLFQQDYQFLFFRCDHNDDPPVFRFSEGKAGPSEVARRFTDWLAKLRS